MPTKYPSEMTPEELKEAGATLFGKYGWQTRLAEALHVHGSTVRRWAHGTIPIPGPASAAIRCLVQNARAKEDKKKQ